MPAPDTPSSPAARRAALVWALALAAGGVGVFLFAGTLRWLAQGWWGSEYYTHGPLVAGLAGWLAWRRLRQIQPAPTWVGLALIAAALLGHLAALWSRTAVGSAFALLLALAGLALWWGGWPALRAGLFPLAFAALAIPLPFVDAWAYPLQVVSARAAAALANLVGVPATFQGGQVALPSCSLVVGAPCSGLRSLVSLTALGVLAAWALEGPLWGRLALVAAAIPLAWLGNVLRVTALLAAAHLWGLEVAMGAVHTASSPLAFMLSVGLLLAVAWGVRCRALRPDL
ncbi:MAG: exosortase/archaeosortase family protein [Chloroflexi bacterium]|nr:exosortase/archaeosortase family protein [Chloroflexota bacterium]